MSITTYSDLQTQIGNWIARSDLTSNIPDFITLFEAYAARRMRKRPSETTTTLTTSSGSVALPSDYLGYRAATWIGGSTGRQLDYAHPDVFKTQFPVAIAGIPAMFTIIGSNLITRPYSDTTNGISFDYYAKNAALSTALNWLFTSHPDAFLFGSLAEAYGFMRNYEESNNWGARRDAIFDEIRLANFREAGGLAVRVMGATP